MREQEEPGDDNGEKDQEFDGVKKHNDLPFFGLNLGYYTISFEKMQDFSAKNHKTRRISEKNREDISYTYTHIHIVLNSVSLCITAKKEKGVVITENLRILFQTSPIKAP